MPSASLESCSRRAVTGPLIAVSLRSISDTVDWCRRRYSASRSWLQPSRRRRSRMSEAVFMAEFYGKPIVRVNGKSILIPCKAARIMSVNEARSARLKAARIAAGYPTAAAAAARFGWPYPTYAQHEGGGGLGRRAASYARAFRVSEAWLLTGSGAGLSPESEELVAIYQMLPPEYQGRLLDDARILRRASGTPEPGEEAPPGPSPKEP